MRKGKERTLQYKGYDVFVMEDGDINIYKNGRFVIHANCSVMQDEEEILNAVENMLAFHDKIKCGNIK